MKYDYDILTIGLGPAGMAVSIMGSSMGLKVCAIEKNKIGGECMNVGCIPSKALIKIATKRNILKNLVKDDVKIKPLLRPINPFNKIQKDIEYILKKKTMAMFDKVNVIYGNAKFSNKHCIIVDGKKITANKIFVATGTRPNIPLIPNIEEIDFLTNENIFDQEELPESLTIIGGGAIGCELAQAFSRLGCTVTIIHNGKYLLPFGNTTPGRILEEQFTKEGITVLNDRNITNVQNHNNNVIIQTNMEEVIVSEKLLLAAGRTPNTETLDLHKAQIKTSNKGIIVNKYLQTNQKNIFAVGDINGHYLLSHAAMHQGMLALMNSITPFFKQNFKKFVVPWTVFTEPQISFVGKNSIELKNKNISYQTIESKYADYGAAIAEDIPTGLVEIYASKLGKIYGACIIGEGSGEMINEWALAIQKNIRLHDIMMLQHSFPTMSFLNKRIAENWMMKKMESGLLPSIIKSFFRIINF